MFRWTVHLSGGARRVGIHCAVVVEHKIYYFEGFSKEKTYLEVSVFNTVSLRWKKLPPQLTSGRGQPPLEAPPRRHSYSAVPIEDAIYIWGGFLSFTLTHCNVLYAFDVDTHRWFNPEVSGTVPEGRERHSACVLEKAMYVYGGSTGGTRHVDIYKLDTSTMVWSLINNRGTPQDTSCPLIHTTIVGTKMFLFESIWNPVQYDNLRVFDTETNCWLSKPSATVLPERHWYYSPFVYNGQLYLFGGDDYLKENFNDLFIYYPETSSWKKVGPKGKCPFPTIGYCCCIVGDRVFLFGGVEIPHDLYVLDLNPSLKALCKLAVVQFGLEQSELPHDIRWELAAMTISSN